MGKWKCREMGAEREWKLPKETPDENNHFIHRSSPIQNPL